MKIGSVGRVLNAAISLTSKRFKNHRASGASIAIPGKMPVKSTKRVRVIASIFFVSGVSFLNSVRSGFPIDPKSSLFQRTAETESLFMSIQASLFVGGRALLQHHQEMGGRRGRTTRASHRLHQGSRNSGIAEQGDRLGQIWSYGSRHRQREKRALWSGLGRVQGTR